MFGILVPLSSLISKSIQQRNSENWTAKACPHFPSLQLRDAALLDSISRHAARVGWPMPRDGLRPLAQLALLLLPAVTLGVTVENELCPAGAAETKLCSARQDFVLVVDVSYSRQPYFEEFKAFLLAFLDQIGLDGTEDGPRVSVVSFHGSVHANPDEFWTDEESTTYLDLTNSRSEVENFVRNMDDPNAECTETGGCTCISCGANVAWARIPVDSRNGAAHPAFRSPTRHSPRPHRILSAPASTVIYEHPSTPCRKRWPAADAHILDRWRAEH